MTSSLFEGYEHEGFFDEFVDARGEVRPHYRQLALRLGALTPEELFAGAAVPNLGVTVDIRRLAGASAADAARAAAAAQQRLDEARARRARLAQQSAQQQQQ